MLVHSESRKKKFGFIEPVPEAEQESLQKLCSTFVNTSFIVSCFTFISFTKAFVIINMLRLGIKTGSIYSSQFFVPVYFFSSVRYLASVLGAWQRKEMLTEF